MATGKAIVQQIRLDGGLQIKTTLESIGAAGKKAFTDLQNAVQSNRAFGNIGAAIESVKAKAVALGDAGRKLGGDMSNLGSRVGDTTTKLALVTAGITGTVAALAAFVVKGGDTVDKLEKIAAELGTTTAKFENMRNAAEQAGVDEDELTRALRALRNEQQKAAQTADGFATKQFQLRREFARGNVTFDEYLKGMQKIRDESNDSETAFSRLGVSILSADGSLKNINDLRDDVADALKGISDETERSARAFDLLGTRSAKTLTFFARGSEAIRGMERESERTAPALRELQKTAIGLADNGFKSLRRAIDSVMNGVRAVFAPVLGRVFDQLTELIARNRTDVLLFAASIADRVRPVVEDLIALIEGRDKDVKNSFILKARDAMVEFGTAAKKAVNEIILPAFAILLKTLDVVAKTINGLFGTSGQQILIAAVIAKLIGIFGIFTGVVKVAVSAIGLLVAAFGGVPVAIAAVGLAIGFVLVRALQSVNWKGFVDASVRTWDSIKAGVAGVGTFIANALNTAIVGVSDAWNTSVEFVKSLWTGLLDFFASLPETIGAFFVSVGNAIVDAFNSAINSVVGFFEDLWSRVTSIFNSLMEKARQVAASVAAAFGAGGGNESGPGFAGGGYTGNRGVRRIAGVVHGKEHVQPARVVARPGVLQFLETLRRNGGDLHGAISRFVSGFDMGGFVDSLSPGGGRRTPSLANGMALAGVGGGNVLNLHFPGQMIGPVMADDDVLTALRRKSVSSQARSAGKKPNWVGG